MKCIAGILKQSLVSYKREYAYANEIVVLAEGLNMFRLGAFATGGRMHM
jgi:Tfp pilus assembly protein PilX